MIWALAHSAFSALKAKPSGWSAARRRTLMNSLFFSRVRCSSSRVDLGPADARLLAVNDAGANRVQPVAHISLQRIKANRGRSRLLQGHAEGVAGHLARMAGYRLGRDEDGGADLEIRPASARRARLDRRSACGDTPAPSSALGASLGGLRRPSAWPFSLRGLCRRAGLASGAVGVAPSWAATGVPAEAKSSTAAQARIGTSFVNLASFTGPSRQTRCRSSPARPTRRPAYGRGT